MAATRRAGAELKVVTQDGNEVFFKCKPTTALDKLMKAFCQRQGIAINTVRFLFDGNRIRENQTPEQLEMEDGDSIDVVVEQVGGTPTGRHSGPHLRQVRRRLFGQ